MKPEIASFCTSDQRAVPGKRRGASGFATLGRRSLTVEASRVFVRAIKERSLASVAEQRGRFLPEASRGFFMSDGGFATLGRRSLSVAASRTFPGKRYPALRAFSASEGGFVSERKVRFASRENLN
jgi:hypothetical protein